MTMLEDAKVILKEFGFDKARYNDRGGRKLLALAQLTESDSWNSAENPMLTVRDILDWVRNELSFPVAENTRETYRRQTLHQFRDAGLVIYNDDDPGRPTNSSKNNYRINPEALKVMQLYGTDEFEPAVRDYKKEAPGLEKKYRAARSLTRIPVTLPGGKEITIGGGGQNVLIKQMVDDFCAYFVQGVKFFT